MNERNPLDLNGQRLDAERQQALAEQAQRRDESDIKWMMSQAAGRRIMWGMLGRAGIFRTSFTGNSTTFFNEGRRDLGLYYLNLINSICPDQYVLMAKEAAENGKPKNE